ncbi:unnamed protein product [Allacma fusca]|uniref:Uncharacterized protein n=1 Tax=Allacma fusca TaxID=39272 RepID=A0A8J2PC72_9HEXA|nr:unnamed protein product [Allacma fusca]
MMLKSASVSKFTNQNYTIVTLRQAEVKERSVVGRSSAQLKLFQCSILGKHVVKLVFVKGFARDHVTMQNMCTTGLFVLIVILVQCSHGTVYGPSLEFLAPSDPTAPKRVIKLEDYAPDYSVVVPLAINKTMAEPRLVRPVGEFAVEAPENMRIMAVIQSLQLRNKSVTSAFPPVCRDYILFGDDSIHKVCGNVQKSDRKGSPNGIMGDRTYFSQGNVLNVTFFTDISTFVEEWMMTLNIVEIAFTAYQNCPFYDPDERMFNCLDNVIPYGPSCISSNLTCDGVINCGFLNDETFGKDELNCSDNPVPVTTLHDLSPVTTPSVATQTKTGFPSWWENYQKMNNERAKLLNLDLQNDNVKTEDKIQEHPVEIHTRFFEPEFKSNSGYFNSFVLYTLCFFVGVSGISVILKILTKYCAGAKPGGSDSGSTLMQDSSSTTTVVIDHIKIHKPQTAINSSLQPMELLQKANVKQWRVPFIPTWELRRDVQNLQGRRQNSHL